MQSPHLRGRVLAGGPQPVVRHGQSALELGVACKRGIQCLLHLCALAAQALRLRLLRAPTGLLFD